MKTTFYLKVVVTHDETAAADFDDSSSFLLGSNPDFQEDKRGLLEYAGVQSVEVQTVVPMVTDKEGA